jgi:hypothetical protein
MESQPAHPSFPRKGNPELERREFDVGPVAQIGAAQILGNLFDDRQVRDVDAVIDRREDAVEIRIPGRIDRLGRRCRGRLFARWDRPRYMRSIGPSKLGRAGRLAGGARAMLYMASVRVE